MKTQLVNLCLAIAILCLALSGCMQSVPVTPGNQAELANHLAYFKDKFGICYAAVLSQTSGGWRIASITSVPCVSVHIE